MSTTYDPKKVSVVVDGKIVTGFAADSVVNVSHNENSVTPTVGCKGDTAYSENANESGTIALSLQHTSASLSYMRSLAADRKQFPVSIIDSNADDPISVAVDGCRFLKMPDLPRGKEVGNVAINIHVPHLVYR